MTKRKDTDHSLEGAYALETPEDSRRLYASWAESYDRDFAQSHDYRSPMLVAEAFCKAGGQGVVLDVGAGTGLCGHALVALGIERVDATDISPEMLAVAERKGIYQTLFAGDLTDCLPVPDASYDGIVSSGTFTNGHVGPEVFDELLRIARSGALFALTIHTAHYASQGFAEKLASLSGQIDDLQLTEVKIYGPGAPADHADDTVFITMFRKSGGQVR